MSDQVNTNAFTELRPLLFSVAYRMLGQASDAEDMVQEAWLRYARTGASDVEVRDLRSWSVQVVTRLCLDELRSARVQRERYVGPWLPEPVLSGEATDNDPLAAVERRDLLSLGALALLERLSPTERAVLVLREAVGLSHAEIARTVEITEAASRQLLARARRHVVDSPARATPSRGQHRRLVDVLRTAFDTGDFESLVTLMREDVVLVSDTGGEAKAPRRPIRGRDKVLRFSAGVRTKVTPGHERFRQRSTESPRWFYMWTARWSTSPPLSWVRTAGSPKRCLWPRRTSSPSLASSGCGSPPCDRGHAFRRHAGAASPV